MELAGHGLEAAAERDDPGPETGTGQEPAEGGPGYCPEPGGEDCPVAPGIMLNPGQRAVLDAITRWHGDGGWPPLRFGGLAGTGKGHPHGTGVLTPTGFTPVEDILPGDLVIGSDGQPVKVRDTYRRGVLPVYRVLFNDGSSVRVDGDHLWKVRGCVLESADHVKRTCELAGTLRKRWEIPQVSAPVELTERDLPIDPYILGVLLGDGTFTSTTLRFTPGDKLVPAEVARRLPSGLSLNYHSRTVESQDYYSIVMPDADRYSRGPCSTENSILVALKDLGLWGKLSAGKFIPGEYLYASADQRLDLLRGLMDTDGEWYTRTYSRDGNRKPQEVTGFSSASETLCDQVQFLIESFGGVARKSTKQVPGYTCKGERRTGQPSHRLNINSPVNPFLTRKGWEPNKHFKPKRVIRSIEPDGEAEITCLRVDATDSLYLTEHCIVTHNSTLIGLLPGVLPGQVIAYVSYTGKAVSVMRSKLPGDVPAERISTLHRLLYKPVATTLCTASEEIIPGKALRCGMHASAAGPCPARHQVSFTPVEDPLAGLDLVVVDEASMVPGRLWEDLTSHGVPVLAVGDHGQLPPVQSSFNLMEHPDLVLEEIHRQAAGDPSGMAILSMARWAREQGHIPHGWYGPDVVKIRPHELCQAGLHPAEADMILCATNATRVYHNSAMRAWYGRGGPPAKGDVVICLRNNYDEGLYNGMRGVVLENTGETGGDGEPAWGLVLDLEGLDEPWEGAVAQAPFGQFAAGAGAVRDRDLAAFDYGYALTVHRSQGSQADKVVVIEENWPDRGTEMRRRWLYTAVSRASRVLTVAGW